MGRELERRTTFAREDILQLIRDNDLSNVNTFLVLNGGTGVGKTSSIMTEVKHELELKFNKSQTMLVVESRSITVEQINTSYIDAIETFNGIDTCQRMGFMHRIDRDEIDYDWIIIDECHGLFSEASFAEDAEYIASWIRSRRPQHTHIIFVTANDEYFDALSKEYFPGNFNFIYLFPDFTRYESNTYVKEIQVIRTNRIDNTISTLLKKQTGKKGIIFLKKASDVKDWFFRALSAGLNIGMLVSQANETTAALTTYQAKLAQDAAINISEGQAGLTLADLCELYDRMRERSGQEGIRRAINNERLPDDIDILFATDTLQEGVSIKSHIDFIIIEGFEEVEVRQKLGRFRGNLDLLYIIFNPNAAQRQIIDKYQTFNKLWQLQKQGNQAALAEAYGRQVAGKVKTIYVKKDINENGEAFYYVNEPAYLNSNHEFHFYLNMMNNMEQAVLESYSYPLLEGAPKIINYNDDIRNFNLKEQLQQILEKWYGIPLKGPAQTEFVQDFIDEGISDKNGRKITTFIRACNLMKEFQFEFKTKKATKNDLIQWPQYLSTPREEYKILI